ncbi:hypothetical protein F0919_10040 [Taibaiella lutea]|uniref:Uncharacterized protein n=1 Tax=Taibaiella lutea TaxID=2608001 RepID=A0A5M6CKH4_9BACT|nr:hypothetical protein [Taibaiella lutea]KAA5534930.1 hypothetical protein F0919_10040 [Taibaiella lutea]
MKTIIRKTAIAAAFIFAVVTSSFNANAQEDNLVYEINSNPSIGITIPNAVGASYLIKNQNGAIVYKGQVKSDKTFYIPTKKLGTGKFCFYIGSLAIQSFQVK